MANRRQNSRPGNVTGDMLPYLINSECPTITFPPFQCNIIRFVFITPLPDGCQDGCGEEDRLGVVPAGGEAVGVRVQPRLHGLAGSVRVLQQGGREVPPRPDQGGALGRHPAGELGRPGSLGRALQCLHKPVTQSLLVICHKRALSVVLVAGLYSCFKPPA